MSTNETNEQAMVTQMSMTEEQREELQSLSKELFNAASRYQTLLKKGEAIRARDLDGKPLTYKTKEGNDTGIPLLTIKRYTPESLLEHLKEMRTTIQEEMAKRKAELEKQKAIKEAQQAAGGSVA